MGSSEDFGRYAATVQFVGHLVCDAAPVALDPLCDDRAEPFTVELPPGRHRVGLAYPDTAIGLVGLWFSERPAVRWEQATLPGQDLGLLGPGNYYGIPVSSGTAAFADSAHLGELQPAGERWLKLIERRHEGGPPEIDGWPCGTHGQWMLALPTEGGHRAIYVSCPMGDGGYPCVVGFDADGAPVAITMVTDGERDVVPDAPDRPEYRRRHVRQWWEELHELLRRPKLTRRQWLEVSELSWLLQTRPLDLLALGLFEEVARAYHGLLEAGSTRRRLRVLDSMLCDAAWRLYDTSEDLGERMVARVDHLLETSPQDWQPAEDLP